jgi:16S rRNA (uracil1498-N3)-methyltransferase
MEIAEPQLWAALVEQTRDVPVRVFAHPGGAAALPPMPSPPALAPAFLGAVGPEGGFTAEELALAEAAHWQTIDLGPRILRVETAAIVLAALAPSLLRLPAGDRPTRTHPSY